MLAEKNVVTDGDGDRVLEVTSDGEHRRQAVRHANAQRRVTAGPAQDSGAAARQPHNRIVAGADDGAIVHQEMIGNVFQARRGFFVGNGDGLVAAVAAGGDQRKAALLHQQMMQRRVWQHDAEIRRAVGHVPRNVGAGAGLEENNRRGLRLERFELRRRNAAVLVGHRDGRHHEREWLFLAMLALAETRDRSRLTGVAQKLESANAFQGNDLALAQSGCGVGDGAAELWPADWARVGLGVEAAVGRVLVFLAASRAERKLPHRRIGPVVRNVDDDGVARSAVGAVGEGIKKAAVGGIEQFFAAVGTGR